MLTNLDYMQYFIMRMKLIHVFVKKKKNILSSKRKRDSPQLALEKNFMNHCDFLYLN